MQIFDIVLSETSYKPLLCKYAKKRSVPKQFAGYGHPVAGGCIAEIPVNLKKEKCD